MHLNFLFEIYFLLLRIILTNGVMTSWSCGWRYGAPDQIMGYGFSSIKCGWDIFGQYMGSVFTQNHEELWESCSDNFGIKSQLMGKMLIIILANYVKLYYVTAVYQYNMCNIIILI